MKSKIKIIILAAGKGLRIQSKLPKALVALKGKSMIKRLLESVAKSGLDNKPVIVVGHKKELVMRELGKNYNYVNQQNQLGTGHAVMMAKKYLKNSADHIVVLYGDHPFVKTETIKKITREHIKSGKKITMATVKLPDFQDWRIGFKNFSRIVRDENGRIVKDVQIKDASEKEKRITEVNPCYFCFETKWLWPKLETLKNNNAQKEYYLTDVIKLATEKGMEIESIEIEPHEALGANTKEELEILEKFAV